MTNPWWCDCCVWVEIQRCEDECNGEDTPRVFCHEDNLPSASGVYKVAGCCYTVRIDADRGVLPPGVDVVDLSAATDYDTCNDCINDSEADPGVPVDPPPADFPPPGQPGPPLGPGTPGGSGGPPSPGNPGYQVPQVVKANVCDPAANPDAPEVWVFEDALPTDANDVFVYANYCYEAPSGPIVNRTDGMIIVSPVYRYNACSACGLGIRAALCPEYIPYGEPRERWVEEDDIPAAADLPPGTTHVYWRIDGLCYKLDIEATTSQIPNDAERVVPKEEFASCEECYCGDITTEPEKGIPFVLCDFEPEGEALWLREADIPNALTYTKIDGTCYYVQPPADSNPDNLPTIPVGSRIGKIDNTYDNCAACQFNWIGGGIDFEPWPNPPLPPPPPFPYNKMIKCSDGTTVGWVDSFLYPSGFVYKPGPGSPYVGQCLEVTAEQLNEDDPAAQPQISLPNAQKFSCCEQCEAEIWTLIRCDNGSKLYTTNDLSGFNGQVVRLDNTEGCWQVFTFNCFVDDRNPNLSNAVVEANFDDCPSCENSSSSSYSSSSFSSFSSTGGGFGTELL